MTEFGFTHRHICPRPRPISRMTWFVTGGVFASVVTGILIVLIQNFPDQVVHFFRSK